MTACGIEARGAALAPMPTEDGDRVLVFAREVFICRCSTVLGDGEAPRGLGARLRLRRGGSEDLARLDPAHHDEGKLDEMRSRLARGEYWLLGELEDDVVTYTWLHARDRADYPYLPRCEVRLDDDTGYGYDAWTSPELRGHGLRRVAFARELEVLRSWGLSWEASFFVKHQLDGAARSLARVGVSVEPLWRVWLDDRRRLAAEALSAAAGSVAPAWVAA